MAVIEPPLGVGAGHGVSESRATVRVLDEDPELADRVEPRQRDRAARAAVARLLELGRGQWSPLPEPAPGRFAAVVLEGLIYVRVGSGGRAHGELLGPRDVVTPWTDPGTENLVAAEVSVRVMSEARLAWLDHCFLLRTARWPEIHAALMERLVERTRRLGLQNAINAVPRIDRRLESTLWQLAERFGRVTPQGVALRLPLSHAQLAEMIAAQRPSVTCAIRRLREGGRLEYHGGPEWLLPGSPPGGTGVQS